MSTSVSFNGSSYSIPATSESNWGTTLSSYLIAIASGTLQRSGGVFTLTAEVDYGATYGAKLAYLKSQTANASATGVVRLANTDGIGFRNAANSADLILGINSSNQLTFGGNPIISSTALSSSKALASDGAGMIVASAVTATELGYVSGVTSAIQTQINANSTSITTNAGTVTTHIADQAAHGATSANTVSKIVARDGSGNFSAGTITANLTGNASGTAANVTGTVAVANGGTNLTSYTTGDLLYASGASTLSKLGIGTTGQALVVSGGVPAWGAAASSGGGINYVSASAGNSDAEINTTGWTPYANAAATPTTLSGGSPTATWTRVTATPLRGAGSFLYTAGALGNGVAYTITPDRADIKKGAVMSGSFDYEVSGTTTTGDYTVWVYDVANSALIQPTGYQVQGGVSTSGYKHIFTFQLPTNGTTFRVGIHQAVASPAGNLTVDNVIVGPQAIQYGAPVTDWTAYTVTITGSTSNPTKGTVSRDQGYWRRVGGQMEIRYEYKQTGAGSAGSGSYRFSLPSGYSIDTALLNSSPTTGDQSLGDAAVYDGTTLYPASAVYGTTTTVSVAVPALATLAGSGNATLSNANARYSFSASVPISGWSSTVQMSNDTDTRVVSSRSYLSANQTGVNTNNSFVKINLDSRTHDTHGAFDTTNKRYVIPVSGYYRITGGIQVQGANVLNNLYQPTIYVDGVQKFIGVGQYPVATGAFSVAATDTCYLNAGQYVELYLYGAGNNSASTLTVASASTGGTFLTVDRLSGPSAIAASEKVYLQYINNAGGTPTADVTNIDWMTKVVDSHGAWSGTVFTAPRAGLYLFAGNVKFGTVRDVDIGLWIDGVKKAEVNQTQATNSNGRHTISGGYYLNAGQTLSLRLSNSYALGSSTTQHTITIWSQG